MKTITESGLSKVENEALREKLYQLTCEFPISYIFYHPGKATEPAHITILLRNLDKLKASNLENGFATAGIRAMPYSTSFPRERWILNTVQVIPLWPAIAGGQLSFIRIKRKKNVQRQTGTPLKRNSKDTGKAIITTGIYLYRKPIVFKSMVRLPQCFFPI